MTTDQDIDTAINQRIERATDEQCDRILRDIGTVPPNGQATSAAGFGDVEDSTEVERAAWDERNCCERHEGDGL